MEEQLVVLNFICFSKVVTEETEAQEDEITCLCSQKAGANQGTKPFLFILNIGLSPCMGIRGGA